MKIELTHYGEPCSIQTWFGKKSISGIIEKDMKWRHPDEHLKFKPKTNVDYFESLSKYYAVLEYNELAKHYRSMVDQVKHHVMGYDDWIMFMRICKAMYKTIEHQDYVETRKNMLVVVMQVIEDQADGGARKTPKNLMF